MFQWENGTNKESGEKCVLDWLIDWLIHYINAVDQIWEFTFDSLAVYYLEIPGTTCYYKINVVMEMRTIPSITFSLRFNKSEMPFIKIFVLLRKNLDRSLSLPRVQMIGLWRKWKPVIINDGTSCDSGTLSIHHHTPKFCFQTSWAVPTLRLKSQ